MLSRSKGVLAEEKSCEYLISQGFKIITTNYYAKKLGEIDIIAFKENTYHFVEVKSATDYETAVNNITPNKLSKIIKSVEYYLQKEKIEEDFCIDAIIIVENSIEYLPNITL